MKHRIARAAPLGAAFILALACTSASAATGERASGQPAEAQRPPDYLYVCNQDGSSVSIIDLASLEVVKTVRLPDLGFSGNAKPHHIAVEPDGSHWYLTLIADNRIVKLDATNRVIGQATFETPGLLKLLPGRNLLYVGRSMSAVNPPQRIGVIDPTTMTLDEIDVFFPRPHALDARPQEDYAYSASLAVNQIISLNIETEATKLVEMDGPPHALAHSAVSPDGRTLVITTHMPHMMVFDLSDPAAPRMTKMVDVGQMPWYPVFTQDGAFVYVANNGSNDVSVVDARTWTVVTTIRDPGLSEPYGSTISPDGRYLLITGNNAKGAYTPKAAAAKPSDIGTVVVIDIATNTVRKVIEVGKGPTGLAVRHPM